MVRKKRFSWKAFLVCVCEGAYGGIPSVFRQDVVHRALYVGDTLKDVLMFMRKVCLVVGLWRIMYLESLWVFIL